MSYNITKKIVTVGNAKGVIIPKGFKLRNKKAIRMIADGIIILCEESVTKTELRRHVEHLLEEIDGSDSFEARNEQNSSSNEQPPVPGGEI